MGMNLDRHIACHLEFFHQLMDGDREAGECLRHLRRYLEMLFDQPEPKEEKP
jgi:poly-beta-hydroxyalkanoate depolymerase